MQWLKYVKRFYLVSGIFCFTTGGAFAAPPVINSVPTNPALHKQSISISGTGFGQKIPAAPLRYIDFDDGIVGQEVPNNESGGGLYIDGGGQIVYDNTHQRFPGDISLQQNFNNGLYGQIVGLNNVTTFRGATKLYIHGYWFMKTYGHMPRNSKFPRMGYEFTTPNWQSRIEGENNSCSDKPAVLATLKPGCPMQDGDGAWGGSGDWDTILGEDGQWHRFDSYLDLKEAHRWSNVDNKLFLRELSTTDMTENCTHDSIGYVYFAHYWSNEDSGSFAGCTPTPEAQRWWDEIYIDTTQARVEICDASTWSTRSHCEIQIPSAWSDSSLTFTVNKGSFTDSDEAYLFVINENGEVSEGKRIYFGESDGVATDNSPVLAFTAPTTASTYTLESTTEDAQQVTIAGTASDDNTVESISYTTDNGQNGTATSNDGFATWSVPVTVNKNETVVTTVTVTDDAGQTTSKTMTITCTCPVGWDAQEQAGDDSWTDSSVTYCVRLLVEGDSITDSGGQVVLGFQGRDSGNYTIRNVSIAERDPDGGRGDVLDDTWTKVTFDGTKWDNSVTVVADSEKLSDPATLNLKPGTDYYVTFKIDSPSVYLDPPADYEELYFSSADHTSDIDWSGNGHSVTRDYHALSKIYVYDSRAFMAPPVGFQMLQ